MDADLTFGNWLQKRRKTLDLTRAELAQSVGCSVSALRKIESDERQPSKQLAGLLADHLEIPAEERNTFIRYARGDSLREPFHFSAPSTAPYTPFARSPGLTNLPFPSAPLVGRGEELALIERFLQDPQCRLLTLVGLSGIGKTRLAVEAARRLEGFFADGVVFIPLTSLGSAVHLLPIIAGAIGLQLYGPGDIHTQLLNHLSQKSLLLILDNFECRRDSADVLTEIVQYSASVKFLVTTVERLCLKDEWVLEIKGLPASAFAPPDGSEKSESVDLFLQAARRILIGFEPSAKDQAAIGQICRLLEGMPLGIELAASCVSVLSPSEIAQEIAHSLDFLSTSLRDTPQRQRSLRAAFEYSWILLTPEEQHALKSLTIFRGAFSRQASERVCGVSLFHLNSLVSKSLLRKSAEGRFELHDLVRQYATGQLRGDPADEAVLRQEHARYFLTQLGSSETDLTSSQQKETIAGLVKEIEDLRQAWIWAVNKADFPLLNQAAWALWYIFQARHLYREGQAMLEQAVRAYHPSAEALTAEEVECYPELSYLQLFPAHLSLRQGHIVEGARAIQNSLDVLRSIDNRVGLVNALWMMGTARMFMGQFQAAYADFQESYTLAVSVDRPWEASISALLSGQVSHRLGDMVTAERWLREGLARSRKMGDPAVIAFALSALVEVVKDTGSEDDLEALIQEGIQIATQEGNRFTLALLQEQLAQSIHSKGDLLEAFQLYSEIVELYREQGDVWSESRVLALLGSLKCEQGECPKAEKYFLEALELGHESHVEANLLDALIGLAAVQLKCGDPLLALDLSSIVLQNSKATSQAKARASQIRKTLQTRLTAEQIEQAWQSAQAWTIGQVVDMVKERL